MAAGLWNNFIGKHFTLDKLCLGLDRFGPHRT
nr:hypothetical protein [Escherichia coli]